MIWITIGIGAVALLALGVAAGTLCRLAHVEMILGLVIEQQDADREHAEEMIAGRPPRRVRAGGPSVN